MWENIIKGKYLRKSIFFKRKRAEARELVVTSLYDLCFIYFDYLITLKVQIGFFGCGKIFIAYTDLSGKRNNSSNISDTRR